MSSSSPSNQPLLGYITVLEFSSKARSEGENGPSASELSTFQGAIGGYLILNRMGHPIEFHCTAPIRPNRAQEILYGKTLKSFFYGHQIANALYRKGKEHVFAILTDSPQVLTLQETLDIPLLFLQNNARPIRFEESKEFSWLAADSWETIQLKNDSFLIEKSFQNPEILDALGTFQKSIDLGEPFERIALAIKESQKGG